MDSTAAQRQSDRQTGWLVASGSLLLDPPTNQSGRQKRANTKTTQQHKEMRRRSGKHINKCKNKAARRWYPLRARSCILRAVGTTQNQPKLMKLFLIATCYSCIFNYVWSFCVYFLFCSFCGLGRISLLPFLFPFVFFVWRCCLLISQPISPPPITAAPFTHLPLRTDCLLERRHSDTDSDRYETSSRRQQQQRQQRAAPDPLCSSPRFAVRCRRSRRSREDEGGRKQCGLAVAVWWSMGTERGER